MHTGCVRLVRFFGVTRAVVGRETSAEVIKGNCIAIDRNDVLAHVLDRYNTIIGKPPAHRVSVHIEHNATIFTEKSAWHLTCLIGIG